MSKVDLAGRGGTSVCQISHSAWFGNTLFVFAYKQSLQHFTVMVILLLCEDLNVSVYPLVDEVCKSINLVDGVLNVVHLRFLKVVSV